MKILITGGTGLVGRNFQDWLSTNKPEWQTLSPTRSQANLLDAAHTAAFFAQHQFDAVVHCAGLVGGIKANMDNPVGFLSENLAMGMNVTTAALASGCRKLINLGSSCVYPAKAPNPIHESSLLQGPLEPTNEGYALAKISVMKYCQYLSEQKGLLYKTLIPCNLYGRYGKFEGPSAHMLPAAIAKIFKAKRDGIRQVEIWGTGKARREFMEVGELSKVIAFCLDNMDSMPLMMNVGPQRDLSILEFYQAIAQVIGWDGEFAFDLSKPSGMDAKMVDASLLRSWHGPVDFDLRKGIEIAIKYYEESLL